MKPRQFFDSARAAFFDTLAETWDVHTPPPPEELAQYIAKVVAIGPDDYVLDVGTGTGRMIHYILQYSPRQIIACDISKKMLERAKAKFGNNPTIITLCADAHNLPLEDNSVDVIICHGVFPHFTDRNAALRELFRVSRRGTRLVISHFGGREFVNQVHSTSPSPLIRGDLLPPAEEVAKQVTSAGFTVVRIEDTERLYMVLAVNQG